VFQACPHCNVRLRPGEAYLGWCGECGNSFWQLPRFAEPQGQAPLAAEWRWIARGMVLKLVALAIGAVACLVLAMAADWDVRGILKVPLPVGVGLLLGSIGLDVAGRLLCLATPQARTRWLIIFSVVFQLGAVAQGVVLALSPDADWAGLLIAGMIVGQILAATTYTLYLFFVAVFLRSSLAVTLATMLPVTAGIGVITMLLLVVVLGVIVLCGWVPICGFPLQFLAAKAVGDGPALASPLVAILLVVLTPIELAYAATLAAVAWQLWQRQLLTRRFTS
jgi:hypothetical protein